MYIAILIEQSEKLIRHIEIAYMHKPPGFPSGYTVQWIHNGYMFIIYWHIIIHVNKHIVIDIKDNWDLTAALTHVENKNRPKEDLAYQLCGWRKSQILELDIWDPGGV